MSVKLSEQEQLAIIKEVEEKYSKFLDPNFDASVFLECRDNFTPTAHIESVKIFEMDNAPINPTFTIAIPTYNRCETLKEAIDSALNQDTDEKYEIIVVENVDDFNLKTPAQEMLEKEYRGKLAYYKNKENLGMLGNWNRCLTLAKGRWVCILHSDDILLSSYMAHMRYATEKKPNSILIGNLMHTKKNYFKKKLKAFNSMSNMFAQLPIRRPPPSTLLHHKEKTISTGGYNQEFHPSDDMIFVCRCRKYGEIYTYQEKLHTKRSEISTESQPQTQLECCIIDSVFLSSYILPRQVANILTIQQLNNYKRGLLKNQNMLIAKKIDQILDDKNIQPIKYGNKVLKFIYIVIRYIKNM